MSLSEEIATTESSQTTPRRHHLNLEENIASQTETETVHQATGGAGGVGSLQKFALETK